MFFAKHARAHGGGGGGGGVGLKFTKLLENFLVLTIFCDLLEKVPNFFGRNY